jgi:ADP-heptose:LPS heptosyltransferase
MGFGDELISSGIAKKEGNLDRKYIVGDGEVEYWSSIFRYNPRFTRSRYRHFYKDVEWFPYYSGQRPYIDYSMTTPDKLVFTDFKATPGEIFFSLQERVWASCITSKLPKFIVIEPNIKGTFSRNNKDWGFEKWQSVVDRLSREFVFVQLVPSNKTKVLKGVQVISTPSFRIAMAVMQKSEFILCPEGGVHHAAAALGKEAAVIFGGRISPKVLGYDFHHNLYVPDPDSPCGMNIACEHCKRCMDQIDPLEVIKIVEDSARRRF